MCLINITRQLPDSSQPWTQPETLVARAKDRIGVLAQYSIPNESSVRQSWVAPYCSGHVSLEIQTKCQNHVQTEGDRNDHADESKMPPTPGAVDRRDHKAANHKANLGSYAV